MITDTNVFLSRWPFRRLPYDQTGRLVRKLRRNQIDSAWAASFDALLHKDIEGVNRRLVADCREHADRLLIPFGAVNPTLPDWQEDLRRCAEEHKMPGIRLHPNYHGYQLNDARFRELLDLANQHRLLVQIAVKMEDERTQHPLVQVPAVDTQPLLDLMPRYPKLKCVLTNSLRTLVSTTLQRMGEVENVFFEISMKEGVGGLEKLIESVPYERVLFGSYFPYFNLESSLLKMKESELGEFVRQAILKGNARELFGTQD